MTDNHHTPEGADGLREHFEANMLDGDAIQAGQMLSSESVFEYITELIAAEVHASTRRLLDHIKNDYVLRLRDVILTTDDYDDPLAEKAIKIRNKLRQEIAADIDAELEKLGRGEG